MPLDVPAGYTALDVASLPAFLRDLPEIQERLGGSAEAWRSREVSDGNLNQVFMVTGPAGAVCVKQALPYVRVAGPDWQLPLSRAFFEAAYYDRVGSHVGKLIPKVYHYDPKLFCIVMEWLSPHIILRRGLVGGNRYQGVARDVGEYLARACFFTSDLAQRFETKNDDEAVFAKNQATERITVDLIFADPYRTSPRNRWTTPQLDDMAAAFHADAPLKGAAARWGHRFIACPQALVHGDLHTGSVMVTEDDTRVIDPEFAFYGPIGFDLGAFLGNLLMDHHAQSGLASAASPRAAMQQWLLEQMTAFWEHFRARFLELWRSEAAGDAYPTSLFADAAGAAVLEAERQRFMDGLFADMVGFAAMKTVRRILGFAHNIDFDRIADPARRAACERAALLLARDMLVAPERFASIGDVVEAVRRTAPMLP